MVRSKVTGETSVTMHQCHGGTSWHICSLWDTTFPQQCPMISHALLAASTLTTAEVLCLASRQMAQEPLDVHLLSQDVF